MRTFITAFIIIGLCTLAFAATISGTAYDLNLNILSGTIFELRDTQSGQVQRIVSSNGTFRFEAQNGYYQLIATHNALVAVDTLRISDDASIIHDMILIDDISDLEFLLNETEEELVHEGNIFDIFVQDRAYWQWIAIAIVILIILISAICTVHSLRSRRAKENDLNNIANMPLESTDSLKTDIVSFIRAEDGRTTQKNIRKKFPLSEAKISLVLSELEHEGTIRKIKKGRSNIIILNG